MNLKSALGLSRDGWRRAIDNAWTGLAVALWAGGMLVLAANLSV